MHVHDVELDQVLLLLLHDRLDLVEHAVAHGLLGGAHAGSRACRGARGDDLGHLVADALDVHLLLLQVAVEGVEGVHDRPALLRQLGVESLEVAGHAVLALLVDGDDLLQLDHALLQLLDLRVEEVGEQLLEGGPHLDAEVLDVPDGLDGVELGPDGLHLDERLLLVDVGHVVQALADGGVVGGVLALRRVDPLDRLLEHAHVDAVRLELLVDALQRSVDRALRVDLHSPVHSTRVVGPRRAGRAWTRALQGL